MLLLILSIRQLFDNMIMALCVEILVGGAVYVVFSGIYFVMINQVSVTDIIKKIQNKRERKA